MEIKKFKDSYIYFFLSIAVMLLNFFFIDYLSKKIIIILLIFFVTFLGLPHGALDSLVAKKAKIYSDFTGFIFFNFSYLFTMIIFFYFWLLFPIIALSIFLIISIYHFSEDWKLYLSLYQRLILSTFIISSIVFFQPEAVKSIFYMLTNSNSVNTIILFIKNLHYLIMLCVIAIIFFNFKNTNILLNITTIFTTSVLLNPLLYFLCYFCFFHSVKNYRESSKLFDTTLSRNKNKVIIINLILTLLISALIFQFYFIGGFSPEERLIQVTFVILACLTVPHMLLKLIIMKKNK